MLELLTPAGAQAPVSGEIVQREGVTSTSAFDGSEGAREDPISGIAHDNGATVVSLAGELDLYNAHVVRETLLQVCSESPERLVVDLSAVRFMDSTALGVLIEARTRMPNRRAFLLAAPGLETRRALEISGLDRHFSVHDSLEDALAATL